MSAILPEVAMMMLATILGMMRIREGRKSIARMGLRRSRSRPDRTLLMGCQLFQAVCRCR